MSTGSYQLAEKQNFDYLFKQGITMSFIKHKLGIGLGKRFAIGFNNTTSRSHPQPVFVDFVKKSVSQREGNCQWIQRDSV